jgi:hypothetical protein
MPVALSRKPEDSESRLERFRKFTVAHPRLVKAKDALVSAIRGAEPNSLIFVFGPTGVGKTTLRLKAERLITEEMLSELRDDCTRIPFVSVEAAAPESGSFNWRDHYRRLLHQLDEPLIDYKLSRQAEGPGTSPSRAAMFRLWRSTFGAHIAFSRIGCAARQCLGLKTCCEPAGS